MKAVPNYISFCRMLFSLTLFAFEPLSIAFYAIYIVCGLSDIMDGFIARKIGVTSRLGAKLDTIADLIMTGVLFIVLYPIVSPTADIVLWIISIGMIRLASIVVVLMKYKAFAILHTYGNKISGIILFILPLLLLHVPVTALLYIICVVASLSAIEELIIHLTSCELEVDKRSLFVK